MQIKRWLVNAATAAVLGLAGSAAGQTQMGVPQAAQPPRGLEMNPGMAPEAMEPMTLTDEKVKAFFDAADELAAKGKEAKGEGGSTAATAKGVQLSAESLAIITKHGFKDATEFQRVGYNVGMARSVLMQGGKEEVKKRLDKAQAEQAKTVDRMRGQLTPEQLKLLEGQGGAAVGRARAMENVPDANLEIVKKYEDRMKPKRK
jgi:hypothetical protein